MYLCTFNGIAHYPRALPTTLVKENITIEVIYTNRRTIMSILKGLSQLYLVGVRSLALLPFHYLHRDKIFKPTLTIHFLK